jgi:DNA-binding response OmpR family regulator
MLRVFLVIDDYNELLYLQTLLKKLGFDTEGLQNTKKYADVSLGFNPHVLIATAQGRKVNGIDLIRTIHKNRGFPKIIALHSSEAPINEDDVKGLGIDLILESPTSAKKLILGLASVCDLDQTLLLEKYNKIKTSMNENPADEEMLVASYDETGKEIAVQPKMFRLNEERPIGVSFPLKKEATAADPAINTVDLNLGLSDLAEPLNQQSRPAPAPQDSATKALSTLVSEEESHNRNSRYKEFLAKAEKPTAGKYDRDRIAQFNKKIRSAAPAPDSKEIEQSKRDFVVALYEKAPKK